MEKFFIVIFIVLGIVGIVSSFFSRDKIQKYIKEKNGKHISTKYINGHRGGGSYFIKYYDKHKNIRSVTYYENGMLSDFGDDEIIEYSINSPEYRELERKEVLRDKKAQEFEKKYYKIKEGDLYIKQEFTNPNIGEYVFLNQVKAPNDKYKLGFMNYITVENNKIKYITIL